MKKGFTLIELLGVISVLAVLALIVAVPVTKSIQDAKQKACEGQVEDILSAAKLYGKENMNSLPDTIGASTTITISTLKTNGYLGTTLKNPKTEENIADTTKIKIAKTGNKYWKYTVVATDGTTALDLCK